QQVQAPEGRRVEAGPRGERVHQPVRLLRQPPALPRDRLQGLDARRVPGRVVLAVPAGVIAGAAGTVPGVPPRPVRRATAGPPVGLARPSPPAGGVVVAGHVTALLPPRLPPRSPPKRPVARAAHGPPGFGDGAAGHAPMGCASDSAWNTHRISAFWKKAVNPSSVSVARRSARYGWSRPSIVWMLRCRARCRPTALKSPS